METFIIKKIEDLKAFKDEKRKTYIFKGNVNFKISIYLQAGESIEAGGYIEAGWSIEAVESIKAGGYIEAGEYIFSFIFHINCEKLISKTLPFFRKFWSEMKPLKKWSDLILDQQNCYDSLKNIPTNKEKEEICKWDGWHPILKAQLEMFFELKQSVDYFK